MVHSFFRSNPAWWALGLILLGSCAHEIDAASAGGDSASGNPAGGGQGQAGGPSAGQGGDGGQGAAVGQGGAGGTSVGQGGGAGGSAPQADCIKVGSAEWTMTGADYCAQLGLACAGTAYHHKDACTDAAPYTGCWGSTALSCCLYSMADHAGSEPNTSALWTCQPDCPAGSKMSATEPPKCDDINECASAIDNCSANASCTNEIGSFNCTCDLGYSGDGVTCLPVPADPACITSADQAWKLIGSAYCAQFGLACSGTAYHNDPMCGDPSPYMDCWGSDPVNCCAYSMADHAGSPPDVSAEWTCQ